MTDKLRALEDEETSEVSGGLGIFSSRSKKTGSALSGGDVHRTTATNCPKCHQYKTMTISASGDRLTCSCGHTWTVFI